MKILAPITSASDIEVLNPTIYNTEFFCGYTTDYWERKHSSSFASNSTISVPLNNRNGKMLIYLQFLILKLLLNWQKSIIRHYFLC